MILAWHVDSRAIDCGLLVEEEREQVPLCGEMQKAHYFNTMAARFG
jgi:hypothetical protein